MAITEQCLIFALSQVFTAHVAQVIKDKDAHQQVLLILNSSSSVTKAQPQNSKPCNYYEEINNYVSDNTQKQYSLQRRCILEQMKSISETPSLEEL